ncbi:MAG: AAA family ATPase [Desulfovibrionaceae bacterium]
MRWSFVKTENYVKFTDGIQKIESRGAKEAGMMLVCGAPGFGKTTIVERWASDEGALHLRANVDWTPRYFLTELAKLLFAEEDAIPRGTSSQLFEIMLDRLKGGNIPLVIDEAEFTLHKKAATLEKIRDFSDRAEMTVVLIGMQNIIREVAKHGQINGRIGHVVEFAPATASDIAQTCDQLCEVRLSPDLKAEVHRLSGGRMRAALNIIAAIEQVAEASGLEEVDVPDLDGVSLSFDWQTRTPGTVRARRGGR